MLVSKRAIQAAAIVNLDRPAGRGNRGSPRLFDNGRTIERETDRQTSAVENRCLRPLAEPNRPFADARDASVIWGEIQCRFVDRARRYQTDVDDLGVVFEVRVAEGFFVPFVEGLPQRRKIRVFGDSTGSPA